MRSKRFRSALNCPATYTPIVNAADNIGLEYVEKNTATAVTTARLR